MKINVRLVLQFILLAGCILFYGCGAEQLRDERFFGSWRFKHGRVHTIITFRANGTWVSDIRIADRFEKIVDKKGNIEGTWEVAAGSLKMVPMESGFESEWKVGKTYDYELIEINKEHLQLKDHLGRARKWIRVKSQKQEGKDAPVSKISVGPIVVNVKKSKTYIKERYLCVDLQLVISGNEGEQPIQTLHPKVREAAILNLSNITYDELNTNKKIGSLKTKIRTILNPYMKGAIEDVIINDIVVTRKWDVVKAFLSEYQAELPEDELVVPDEPNESDAPDTSEEPSDSEDAGEPDSSEEEGSNAETMQS